eukprot:855313_1
MTPVKVWQERVEIPTYETGPQDIHPMFLENRVYQGSSGAVYPYGVTDTLSEQKTLKSWQAVWLENDYIKVMILPELGGRVHRAWDKVKQRDFVYHNEVIKPALVGLLGPWISGGILTSLVVAREWERGTMEALLSTEITRTELLLCKLIPYYFLGMLELMLLADVGMLGMPNAGKSTFIRAVSAAKPKVADYPFTTLVPSLGVVRMDNEKSFVVADIPGLIEGAAEGAGLGIRFLKHLERCRVLLHLIDIDPIDGTDPVENARIIISELEKYSQDLATKPRWLVFNKIDLLDKVEAEEKAKAIAEALGWEDKYYLISVASGLGVKDLCWDVMTFIIENPVVQAEEAKQPEKVEFMWDDYHRQQLEEIAEEDDEDWDDDWDEDDEEGVEFIYKR